MSTKAAGPRSGSVLSTVLNTLCNVIGGGVLSLPLTLYFGSIVVGLLVLFLLTVLCAFSVYYLVVGCDATGRYSVSEIFAYTMYPPVSFEQFCGTNIENDEGVDVNQSVLDGLRKSYITDELRRRKRRRIAMVVVETVVFLFNFAMLIVYARVIADSIPLVIESFLHGHGFVVSRTFWLLIPAVVFFVLSCFRNMTEMKWTSLVGFVTIFYIIICIMVRFGTSRRSDNPIPDVPAKEKGSISIAHIDTGIFRALSSYSTAMAYHSNVPYFYRELKDRTPSTMMLSVYISFPIILICYVLTGLLGYLTFGNLVNSTASGGNIVNNYGDNDVMVNIGRLGLFFHFACVYPILSVCARRGLHRLIMSVVKWKTITSALEQNLMEEVDAAIQLHGHATDGAALLTSFAVEKKGNPANLNDDTVAMGAEASEEGGNVLEAAALGGDANGYSRQSAEPRDEEERKRNPLDAVPRGERAHQSMGDAGQNYSFVDAEHNVLVAKEEEEYVSILDKDVGSPEDTPFWAIVLEALFIVAVSVVLAGLIPGIGFAVSLIGDLFGNFIVTIGPGFIGFFLFSPSYMAHCVETTGYVVPRRFALFKRIIGVVGIVIGSVCTVIGFAFLVKDQADGA